MWRHQLTDWHLLRFHFSSDQLDAEAALYLVQDPVSIGGRIRETNNKRYRLQETLRLPDIQIQDGLQWGADPQNFRKIFMNIQWLKTNSLSDLLDSS